MYQRFLGSILFTFIVTFQVKFGHEHSYYREKNNEAGSSWMGRVCKIEKLIDGNTELLD